MGDPVRWRNWKPKRLQGPESELTKTRESPSEGISVSFVSSTRQNSATESAAPVNSPPAGQRTENRTVSKAGARTGSPAPDADGIFVSFVSFVRGAPSGETISEAQGEKGNFSQEEIDQAVAVCNECGVRMIRVGSEIIPHIWSDLDTEELRAAISLLCPTVSEIRYLDSPGVPPRYQRYKPVALIEKRPLLGVLPDAKGISWAEWKAKMLNKLFEEQGTPKKRGRITARSIRDGEKRAREIRDEQEKKKNERN